MLYVPARLVVSGDAAATVDNVQAAETLFRLGVLSGLVSHTVFLLLALTLYRLFADVDRSWASLLVALVVVDVAVAYLNMVNQLAALQLLSGADYLAAFDTAELNALVMVFLDIHAAGITILELFWGLWLIPFGVLVYKSGFVPRILGILLLVGAVGYLVSFLVHVLFPTAETIPVVASSISALGELSIIAWLLVKGVRTPPSAPDATAG